MELATPAPFAAMPVTAAVASDALLAAAGGRVAWPGVHIIVTQLPPMLRQPAAAIGREALTVTVLYGLNETPTGTVSTGTAAAAPPPPNPIEKASGSSGTPATVTTATASTVEHARGAAAPPTHIRYNGGCGDGGAGGGGGATAATAPAVLELNVDGTVVLVERAVLESQAAGSRLYHTLIQGYDKLPLDSQGRPYLSYDPQTFKLLIAQLKERHLFGRDAAARDYGRMADALGVSHQYVVQMASHFGLADELAPPPELMRVPPPTTAAAPFIPEVYGTPPSQPFDPLLVEVTSQQQQQQQHQSSTTSQRLPSASPPHAGGLELSHLHTPPPRVTLPSDSYDLVQPTSSAYPTWVLSDQTEAAAVSPTGGVPGFLPGRTVGQPWDHLPGLRVPSPQEHGAIIKNGAVVCSGVSPGAQRTEPVQLPLMNGVNRGGSGSGDMHHCNGLGDGRRWLDADAMSAAPAVPAPQAVGTAATAALGAAIPIGAANNSGSGSGSGLDVRANGARGTGSGSVNSPLAEPATASPFASGTSGRLQAQQAQEVQPLTVATATRQPLASPPSRIPPPPPVPLLHRPASAPPVPANSTIPAAADAATAAASATVPESADTATATAPESAAATPAAAAAGCGHAGGSPHTRTVVNPPGWWQPFNDEAVPAAAAPQRDTASPAPDYAAADPDPTTSGPAAGVAAAAADYDLIPPVAAAHGAATWPVSTAAAMAAVAERYRVPNLYEVLAKKQRLELENEAGKIA
ncbi:hypothetical protein Vretimale_15338 [Volvox reticuliferus]|nr:hypothetical protein Vretifemale_16502 [Volvox reticuliferus]GIL88546.1 hypothetical protein Vretifemale_16502 [Volvox reticuliferus]GIL88547.1 hypothetical protein Vretifemale_16502 [Volvox reticuliferus]GIM11866.1 hypothetical protein Vretimale_15338 [Volvox reticuliferus]GIM11868.1 hypothetical protein Vretimale_15338 [Volvox reticuliferus]